MTMYDFIKRTAGENGMRVADFLALAPNNDPFYVGRPSQVQAATWFTELWRRFDYGRGVHLRRIHYQIVSQSPAVKLPNGRDYENTMNCWNYLTNAAKYARYLEFVPGEAFVDRRNPEAIINITYPTPEDWGYCDPTPGYTVDDLAEWEQYHTPALPTLPELPEHLPEMPEYTIQGYEWAQGNEQPYHIEVWAEKTTMNDVLIPLCRRYNINLVTGAGELSITAVLAFLKRAQRADRPACILYVSDYDPAGVGMPISVARKVEFYLRMARYNSEVRLEPVVLTAEQVADYDLPRVPVKDSDRCKKGWVATHGAGQTELDALEALHPGELHDIIEQAILQYHDPTLLRRAGEQRYELKYMLDDYRASAIGDHADEIRAIYGDYEQILTAYEQTRQRFEELTHAFQTELNAYDERLADIRQRAREVGTLIESDLLQIDINPETDYPLPEADLPTPEAAPLYDSQRSYGEQLPHYKNYRSGVAQ